MIYIRNLFILFVLICFALALPVISDAALRKDISTKSYTVKKHKSTNVAKSDSTKHNVKGKSTAANSKSKSVAKDSMSRTDSREVWFRRAKENGELLAGMATWYGGKAHGGPTASGLDYDMFTFTAAHRTLPIGTVVKVTDQDNGKSVIVCITDRGPYGRGRIIDLSYAAALQLDLSNRGVGRVNLNVISDEHGTPLNADEAFYVRYSNARDSEMAGPFRAFADAAVLHEALRQAHPEAEVVIGENK
ncbi:hypothetical protein AGMMS49974_04270 [Deltaproteobacteria bacterium]|nr:hypothetical protein AGMMS49974_04270 [Deltaproteobacteria bacterium]